MSTGESVNTWETALRDARRRAWDEGYQAGTEYYMELLIPRLDKGEADLAALKAAAREALDSFESPDDPLLSRLRAPVLSGMLHWFQEGCAEPDLNKDRYLRAPAIMRQFKAFCALAALVGEDSDEPENPQHHVPV